MEAQTSADAVSNLIDQAMVEGFSTKDEIVAFGMKRVSDISDLLRESEKLRAQRSEILEAVKFLKPDINPNGLIDNTPESRNLRTKIFCLVEKQPVTNAQIKEHVGGFEPVVMHQIKWLCDNSIMVRDGQSLTYTRGKNWDKFAEMNNA